MTSSFGFRPKRSAHGAVKQIQKIIRNGYRWCVDMDLSKFFDRVRGISMRQRLYELRLYLRGWIDYFVLEQRKSVSCALDKWLRRRVRACYWINWRLPRTRLKKLTALGVPHQEAYPFVHSGKGPWRLSLTSGVQRALSNTWLQSQGLFVLTER